MTLVIQGVVQMDSNYNCLWALCDISLGGNEITNI